MPARTPALLVLLLLALPAPGARAAPPATASLREVGVLADPSGTETIESVAAAPERFRPLPGGNLAAGYTRDVHWLRFTVAGPPGEWWLDLLPSYLDDLRLYSPDPERPGRFLERRAGDHLPYAAREVPYRGFVFKLHRSTAAPEVHYLRLQTTSNSMLVPRIWSPDAFLTAMPVGSGLLLAQIAILLLVAALGLQSWRWLRERGYLLFSAWITAMAGVFVAAGGFAAQYLFPDRPALTDSWVGVATMAAFASFALWTTEALQWSRAWRLLRPLGWAVAGLAACATVAIPLGGYMEVARLVNALTLMLIAAGLWGTWELWRRRTPGADFPLASLAATLLAFGWTILSLLGLLPGHAILLYGPNLAVVAAILTVHFAISGRYRTIQDERRLAEREAERERGIREEQSKFIDLVTHEYRTPLAILRTNLDILGLTGDEAERRTSLGRMDTAVRRLAEIFDGSLRRGNWGNARQIALERLDPVPLLRDLVERSTDPATGARPPVEIQAREEVRVRADPKLLATVFLNLLDNARKYAPRGRPLEVRVERKPGGAVLRFTNDCAASPGVAMTALGQKHLRGENAKGTTGTGVGLHLVRKLLADQGGALELQLDPAGRFVAIVTLASADEGGRG